MNTSEQENGCKREWKQHKLMVVPEIGCRLGLEVRERKQIGIKKNPEEEEKEEKKGRRKTEQKKNER